MILYYTAGQKTKVFAHALHDVLRQPMQELKSPLNEKSFFIFRALYLAVTGKGYPVSNMPEKIDGKEIYLCSPVWGGNVAGPAWYFLNNANLEGVKVNLLLTCGSVTGSERYRKKALESLQLAGCEPGDIYVFATGKGVPEHSVIVEQLREMLPPNVIG
ncbi:MAG: hypothetical protein LBR83_07735 [Clostridiales bacterium]|jgi:hypothetical protein|nr:hypothetical protein [Clostridiales bacterium]